MKPVNSDFAEANKESSSLSWLLLKKALKASIRCRLESCIVMDEQIISIGRSIPLSSLLGTVRVTSNHAELKLCTKNLSHERRKKMPLYRIYVVKMDAENKNYDEVKSDYVVAAKSRQGALAKGIINNAGAITKGCEVGVTDIGTLHTS